MHIVLISLGNCPSLALRNIRTYCLAHEEVREAVRFQILDLDIREFKNARSPSPRQWSFVTRFDEVVEDLVGSKADVIGFSCYLWNIELSVHLAYLAKRLIPGVRTVFGGPDPGPRAAELLQRHHQIDFVVEGDGEIPFLGLVRQLLAGSGDFSTVPALRYRSGARVIVNPACSEKVDLSLLRDVYDELPSPTELDQWEWPHLLYETARGCPYSCSYCMYGKQPMNQKDPALVVEELAGLLQHGLHVELIDPTFTTYKKRAKQILGGLAEHDYSGYLYFEAYPDSIDEEMVELMAQTRVSCVGVGFQTISTEGLKAVKRPKNLPRFERAVRLLRKHSIIFYADLIYGLPQTTADDFLAAVDYLHSLAVPSIMFHRLLGLPGSPMMDDISKYQFVFNESPPYELFSSATFSLRDIRFCDRFSQAYGDLHWHLDSDEGRRLAAAGGMVQLVRRFMAAGQEDPKAFLKSRAKEPGGENTTLGALARARGSARKVLAVLRRRGISLRGGSLHRYISAWASNIRA